MSIYSISWGLSALRIEVNWTQPPLHGHCSVQHPASNIMSVLHFWVHFWVPRWRTIGKLNTMNESHPYTWRWCSFDISWNSTWYWSLFHFSMQSTKLWFPLLSKNLLVLVSNIYISWITTLRLFLLYILGRVSSTSSCLSI